MGVIGMRPIGPVHRRFWRMGGENRRDTLHLRSKPHVVIPFIVLNEGSAPAGNGVLGKLFDGSDPVRIDRPVGFKITTHALEHDITCLSLGNFNPVMQAD